MRDLVKVARWRRAVRSGRRYHPSHTGYWPLTARLRTSRPPASSNGAFVAVVLVHRRPANVDLQVRAALHAPSIREVVVSCNNPEVRLDDWLTVSSPRLRVRTDVGRNQTRRYAVALESGAERFFLPDDDVLFTPEAIEAFCAEMPADAAAPVGLAGQRLGPAGVWESGIVAPGEEVDVVNRAYACTRAHAEAVFENAASLGWDEAATFTNPADDVLLSFAGTQCPRVVAADHADCVSHDDGRISTFLQPGFHAARAEWVGQLRARRGRAPARRDLGRGGAAAPVEGPMKRTLNVAALPLRSRFYAGRNVRSLSLLPDKLRHAAGLDDYGALGAQRIQIGLEPAPLETFVRIGARRWEPQVTVRAPIWAPNERGLFATEVVAFGALDGLEPALVSMALASWRSMLAKGGRLVVGASAAKWDCHGLGDAVRAQGFEVVATMTNGSDIDRAAGVSPWPVVTARGERPLLPVPAALNGAADIVVVARAR